MPSAKDIRAKNELFARRARENAGKPRVRNADLVEYDENGEAVKRTGLEKGRGVVNSSQKKKPAVGTTALALICFGVIGGVFFELARMFF